MAVLRQYWTLAGIVGLAMASVGQAAPASAPAPHGTNSTAESLYGTGTLFAKYAKIPLVEGHGSYFDKIVALQDPVTKKEFEHSDATLEIISSSMSASLNTCSNLAAEWGNVDEARKSQTMICDPSDFLVKIWPSSQNQAKSYACYCIDKTLYQAQGLAADSIKSFPKPILGQHLALVPMTPAFTAFRPDGSLVEPSRLDDVYAQDLGPGTVNLNTGTRMRFMRFFTKNTRGEFVPLSKTQDMIYQVVDSGLVSSDIPATSLARRSALRRGDGSNVAMDRTSSDMWLRPKFISSDGQHLLGTIMQTNRDGDQEKLNSNVYSIPIDINSNHFGLMSRLRSPDKRLEYAVARMAGVPADDQLIQAPVRSKPTRGRSKTISAALPIISDMRTARQTGYYTHTYADNYVWGRPHVIWNIQEAGKMLAAKGVVMGVGDINRKPDRRVNSDDTPSKAATPNHLSHVYGLAADFRLILKNGVADQTTYKSRDYSADKTFEMIKALIDADPTGVEMIRFNDVNVLAKVRAYLKSKGITGVNVSTDRDLKHPVHHHHVHFAWKA